MVSDWISVKTKLPDVNQNVLIYVNDEYDLAVIEAKYFENKNSSGFSPAWLDCHGCGCCGGGLPKPTHWQPLPEPPNEL